MVLATHRTRRRHNLVEHLLVILSLWLCLHRNASSLIHHYDGSTSSSCSRLFEMLPNLTLL